MSDEKTSQEIGTIAAQYMQHEDPNVRALAGSALTQRPDQPTTSRLRQTHTYAKLEVDDSTYQDIKKRLLAVDYGHTIMDDGCIDMHGIAIEVQAHA